MKTSDEMTADGWDTVVQQTVFCDDIIPQNKNKSVDSFAQRGPMIYLLLSRFCPVSPVPVEWPNSDGLASEEV